MKSKMGFNNNFQYDKVDKASSSKKEASKENARLLKEFLEAGGKIKQCPIRYQYSFHAKSVTFNKTAKNYSENAGKIDIYRYFCLEEGKK